MGTVYGVNATKALNAIPDNNIAQGQVAAGVKVFFDTYEASSLAAGSDIYMLGGELQPGMRIIGGKLITDALGSSTTLTLGDAADADRYLAAYSTSSAAWKNDFIIGSYGYVVGTAAGDDQILCHMTGATATGTIVLELLVAT